VRIEIYDFALTNENPVFACNDAGFSGFARSGF
jgi:hypothetical protein